MMSALPAKAELCGAARDVCFGPIADMPRSLDNAPLYSPLRSSAWLFLGPNSLSILPPGLSELFFLPPLGPSGRQRANNEREDLRCVTPHRDARRGWGITLVTNC